MSKAMHARLSKETILMTRKGKEHKIKKKTKKHCSENQSIEVKDKNMDNERGSISFPNTSNKNHCCTSAIFIL